MDNPQAKTYFNLGWIVGVIESEGWVILNKQLLPSKNYRYIPVIGMNTTSEVIVKKYTDILQDWGVGVWVGKKRFLDTKNKDQWATNVRGFKRCAKLINIIKPYIQLKIKQLELVEELINYRSKLGKFDKCGDVEERIKSNIQALNKKGKASTT